MDENFQLFPPLGATRGTATNVIRQSRDGDLSHRMVGTSQYQAPLGSVGLYRAALVMDMGHGQMSLPHVCLPLKINPKDRDRPFLHPSSSQRTGPNGPRSAFSSNDSRT